jgi:hypothetical protein
LYLTADATVTTVTMRPESGFLGDGLIEGFGTPTIRFGAIDGIRYTGNGAETLVVNPGSGDHAVRVDDSPNSTDAPDRVRSDSLPEILFVDVDVFRVAPSGLGHDVITFVTGNIGQANDYEAVLDGLDTLVIEGSDGDADGYTVTRPAAGSVEVDDVAGVTVTETSGNLGRLQINTLGGDDVVRVDVDGAASNLIGVPITFDGGAGSDVLRVTGTPGGLGTPEGGVLFSEGRRTAVVPGSLRLVRRREFVPAAGARTQDLERGGFGAQEVLDFAVGVPLPFAAAQAKRDFHRVADIQLVHGVAARLDELQRDVVGEASLVLFQHDQPFAKALLADRFDVFDQMYLALHRPLTHDLDP